MSMEYHLKPVNPPARSPRTLIPEGNLVTIDSPKKPSSGSRLLYDRVVPACSPCPIEATLDRKREMRLDGGQR
jgi:hypothetical protein